MPVILKKGTESHPTNAIVIGDGLSVTQTQEGLPELTGTGGGGDLTQAEADLRYLQLAGGTIAGDLRVNARLGVGGAPDAGYAVRVHGSGNFDALNVGGVAVSLAGHTHTFASLTAKPTTVAGYGITDAIAYLNVAQSWSTIQTFSTGIVIRDADGVHLRNAAGANRWQLYRDADTTLSLWDYTAGAKRVLFGNGGGTLYGDWATSGGTFSVSGTRVVLGASTSISESSNALYVGNAAASARNGLFASFGNFNDTLSIDHATTPYLRLYRAGVLRGYFYADLNSIGLLDSVGNWIVRDNLGNRETLDSAGNVRLQARADDSVVRVFGRSTDANAGFRFLNGAGAQLGFFYANASGVSIFDAAGGERFRVKGDGSGGTLSSRWEGDGVFRITDTQGGFGTGPTGVELSANATRGQIGGFSRALDAYKELYFYGLEHKWDVSGNVVMHLRPDGWMELRNVDSSVAIKAFSNNGVERGHLYGSATGWGLLNDSGDWSVLCYHGVARGGQLAGTNWYRGLVTGGTRNHLSGVRIGTASTPDVAASAVPVGTLYIQRGTTAI